MKVTRFPQLSRSLFTRSLPLSIAVSVSAGGAIAAENDPSFEVYGFAMFDYIQDFDRVNPDWEATLRASRIQTTDDPTSANPNYYGSEGQAILSARQSRLGVQANLPVGNGDTIYTKFEFDMYGVGDDAGQTTIRLRHAYGEWRGILAGQTNSLFMDADVFPNTIDYWGPAGMVFLRNPQLRWTPIKGDMTFAVAIEDPSSDVDSNAAGIPVDGVSGNQPLPDITAQFRMQQSWGHFQVAGILRQLAYDDSEPNDANGNLEGDTLGWGINLSSNIKFGADKLMLSLVYGEGIASYMNDGGMDVALDASPLTSSDPFEAVPLMGVVVYYDHYWNSKWSSSIGYSFTEVDNQEYQGGYAFEKGEYASVNLLHTPAKNLLMGVELLRGKRTDYQDRLGVGGDSGTDMRVQFSVKYNFSSLDFK